MYGRAATASRSFYVSDTVVKLMMDFANDGYRNEWGCERI